MAVWLYICTPWIGGSSSSIFSTIPRPTWLRERL
jgi:hypothetical protein